MIGVRDVGRKRAIVRSIAHIYLPPDRFRNRTNAAMGRVWNQLTPQRALPVVDVTSLTT